VSATLPAATSAHALHAALAYAARGWSVMPMQERGKWSSIAWREFQPRGASAPEIERWSGHGPGAKAGVVAGRISAHRHGRGPAWVAGAGTDECAAAPQREQEVADVVHSLARPNARDASGLA